MFILCLIDSRETLYRLLAEPCAGTRASGALEFVLQGR